MCIQCLGLWLKSLNKSLSRVIDVHIQYYRTGGKKDQYDVCQLVQGDKEEGSTYKLSMTSLCADIL